MCVCVCVVGRGVGACVPAGEAPAAAAALSDGAASRVSRVCARPPPPAHREVVDEGCVKGRWDEHALPLVSQAVEEVVDERGAAWAACAAAGQGVRGAAEHATTMPLPLPPPPSPHSIACHCRCPRHPRHTLSLAAAAAPATLATIYRLPLPLPLPPPSSPEATTRHCGSSSTSGRKVWCMSAAKAVVSSGMPFMLA